MLSELFPKSAISSDTNLLTFLSIYPEMNYLELFELEILSRGLTQVFTLINKNTRITELNENKNKLLDRGEGKKCSESCFFYNLTVFTKYFLSCFYTTLLLYLYCSVSLMHLQSYTINLILAILAIYWH
jgi:hypothetical protein